MRTIMLREQYEDHFIITFVTYSDNPNENKLYVQQGGYCGPAAKMEQKRIYYLDITSFAFPGRIV